jgi:hypothetical protein
LNCPSADDLRGFHLGTLPAPDVDAVAEHVESCSTCGAALEALDGSADPLIAVLRKSDGSVDHVPKAPASKPAVPGYEILAVLGEGGMGVVYWARHLRLDRAVALKQIRGNDDRVIPRLHAEALALSRLQHPNIVQIYEVIEHDGRTYLALELVEGGSLHARLRGKPQAPRETAELIEVVAGAVHFAHAHGIVHRDLKPANILLRPQPGGRPGFGIPKITDFGVAKRLRAGPGATLDGQVLGTPSYMAPEQAAGHVEKVGPAADVYSLGVILYEMLTGHVPLQGPSTLNTLMLVQSAEPVPPRRLQPGVPRDLETICLKCLEQDLRQRYASARELAEDLRRFLDGEPTRARPPGAVERLGRWCRGNPVLAGLLLVVFLVPAFGSWYLARLAEQFVRSTAVTSAAMQADMLEKVNSRYSQVVDRLHDRGIEAGPTGGGKAALPVPAAFLTEVGQDISAGESGMLVRHYSDHPFRTRRDGGPRDDLEREALARLRDNPDEPFFRIEQFQEQQVLRYFTARRMKPTCVHCHNTHPDSTKTDWEVGDVRGVLEIVRPLDGDMARTRQEIRGMFVLLGAVSAALLALVVLALVVRKRRGRDGG